MTDRPVTVTKPYLPPLDELIPLLEEIWERRILTNQGPFHQQLEAQLGALFGHPQVSLVSNGMLALELALACAGLDGEVITTPYSFVATTHAIKRANLDPVFVDVRPDDLNLDPDLIEPAITERTSAIVAVHCYGNPCDLARLQVIADKHGLVLIYDAAHAFGVTLNDRAVVASGEYSTLSFHATKAFNTFEGGAVVARDATGKARIDRARNFGIVDEVSIPAIGGNAKMSEFNAALGLLQLRHFEEVREARRRVDERYRAAFEGVTGIEPLAIPVAVQPNFSYFPVLVTGNYPLSRDALYERLKSRGILSRRYFYPLLSNLPMYHGAPSAAPANLPVANQAAEQSLCLPIYHDLSEADQDRVIALVSG